MNNENEPFWNKLKKRANITETKKPLIHEDDEPEKDEPERSGTAIFNKMDTEKSTTATAEPEHDYKKIDRETQNLSPEERTKKILAWVNAGGKIGASHDDIIKQQNKGTSKEGQPTAFTKKYIPPPPGRETELQKRIKAAEKERETPVEKPKPPEEHPPDPLLPTKAKIKPKPKGYRPPGEVKEYNEPEIKEIFSKFVNTINRSKQLEVNANINEVEVDTFIPDSEPKPDDPDKHLDILTPKRRAALEREKRIQAAKDYINKLMFNARNKDRQNNLKQKKDYDAFDPVIEGSTDDNVDAATSEPEPEYGAVYQGYQRHITPDKNGIHLYNLTRDIKDTPLVKGSTVSRQTLQKYNVAHPEPPDPVDRRGDYGEEPGFNPIGPVDEMNDQPDQVQSGDFASGQLGVSESAGRVPDETPEVEKDYSQPQPDKLDPFGSGRNEEDVNNYWKKKIEKYFQDTEKDKDDQSYSVKPVNEVDNEPLDLKELVKGLSKNEKDALIEIYKERRNKVFLSEIRNQIKKLKESRNLLDENSFEGSPSGIGTMNYGQSFGTFGGGNTTQNPTNFKNSPLSPMESGSVDGPKDRMDQDVVGNEFPNSYNESHYPKNEDGSLDTNHTGRAGATILGKIVQPRPFGGKTASGAVSGYKDAVLREAVKKLLKEKDIILLVREMKNAPDELSYEIRKALLTMEIRNVVERQK